MGDRGQAGGVGVHDRAHDGRGGCRPAGTPAVEGDLHDIDSLGGQALNRPPGVRRRSHGFREAIRSPAPRWTAVDGCENRAADSDERRSRWGWTVAGSPADGQPGRSAEIAYAHDAGVQLPSQFRLGVRCRTVTEEVHVRVHDARDDPVIRAAEHEQVRRQHRPVVTEVAHAAGPVEHHDARCRLAVAAGPHRAHEGHATAGRPSAARTVRADHVQACPGPVGELGYPPSQCGGPAGQRRADSTRPRTPWFAGLRVAGHPAILSAVR